MAIYKGLGEQIRIAQDKLYKKGVYFELKKYFPFIKESDFKFIPFDINLVRHRINNYKRLFLYPRNV